MSTLTVLKPGLSSIQDLGRFGLQRYGVAPAGAMDIGSLRSGNTLVDCTAGSPAIEIGPLPAGFEISGPPIRIALTGALRSLAINEMSAAPDQTQVVRDGDQLLIGSARGGMFSYLCFEGGITTEPQYGSSSLDERAGLGSPIVRRLAEGDVFEIPPATAWSNERCLARSQTGQARYDVIRVILGPQDDYFFPATKAQFLTTRWRIANSSNRMCYSLDGPRLAHAKGYNIVSDGTVKGSIQVAGSGQPFVLLADRGTIGGYPKIATIATIDMDRFVQIPPGGELRFESISVEKAQSLLRTQAASGRISLKQSGTTPGVDETALFSANLAGLATNALDPTGID